MVFVVFKYGKRYFGIREREVTWRCSTHTGKCGNYTIFSAWNYGKRYYIKSSVYV